MVENLRWEMILHMAIMPKPPKLETEDLQRRQYLLRQALFWQDKIILIAK